MNESKINKRKKVCILGVNGYIGTALYFYLSEKGYAVAGCDNNLRDDLVKKIGGDSLTEKRQVPYADIDITNFDELKKYLITEKPDVIVNLAQIPSAPYSMMSQKEADETLVNNIRANNNVMWAIKEVCPDVHLIKLGTAGEYPDWLYPEMEIPEGHRIRVKYQDKDWTIPTPRYFGSVYHSTKFYDSFLNDYFNRIWGLRVTDINQGPVYGCRFGTRFDYDEHFGTVVNRFAVQAVSGIPLTIYGEGNQTRGYIHIENALQAIELWIENEPEVGEYRVVHQVTETHTINEIAQMFVDECGCEVQHLDNPRAEQGSNKFTFEGKKLKDFGLKTIPMKDEIKNLLKLAEENKERIITDAILPKTNWGHKTFKSNK